MSEEPITPSKVMRWWKTAAAIAAAVVTLCTVAFGALSTKFASIAAVTAQERQIERMSSIDDQLAANVKSVRGDVKEVKDEVRELRKDQQRINENLVRLMERFSVKPVGGDGE